jgi:small subunit ribosomal protein S16
LARGGKRHRPYYRIVVADSRAPRDGKFIERIGSYDPLLTENKVSVDVERATYWLGVGAKPSERVSKLLALQGMEHKQIVKPQPAAAEPARPAKGKRKAATGPAAAPAAEAKAEAKAGGGEESASS